MSNKLINLILFIVFAGCAYIAVQGFRITNNPALGILYGVICLVILAGGLLLDGLRKRANKQIDDAEQFVKRIEHLNQSLFPEYRCFYIEFNQIDDLFSDPADPELFGMDEVREWERLPILPARALKYIEFCIDKDQVLSLTELSYAFNSAGSEQKEYIQDFTGLNYYIFITNKYNQQVN